MFSPFSFVQISDSHVRIPEADWHRRVVQTLAAIQSEQPTTPFVIHTGDLVDDPTQESAEAFHQVFSDVKQPLYVVPGNHDVWNDAVMGEGAPWWTRATTSADENQFRAWFGPTSYSFIHNDCAFVAFNSQLLNGSLPESVAQWDWLTHELARLYALQLTHIVFFTHMPLFLHSPDEQLDWGDWRNSYLVIAPPARDRLLELIRRYRVTGYLCGHWHYPRQRTVQWSGDHSTVFINGDACGPVSVMAQEHFGLGPRAERSWYCVHQMTQTEIVTNFKTLEKGAHGT